LTVHKKATSSWWPFGALRRSDILMEQPGQAKPTEGSHEYSVDVMNTSFSLLRMEGTKKSLLAHHSGQAAGHAPGFLSIS